MRSRTAIMIEFIFVVGAIISIPILAFILKQLSVIPVENQSPSYMILLPAIPILFLAFKSSKWLVYGMEKFTGFKMVFFGKGMIFIFFAGLFLSIVIIPLGLVGLIMEYLRARPA